AQPTGNGPQCRLVDRWESQAPMRRRNATATTVVAIAAIQSTSNEPSPPSGAIPNRFSMKSMALSFVQRGSIEGSSHGQPHTNRQASRPGSKMHDPAGPSPMPDAPDHPSTARDPILALDQI